MLSCLWGLALKALTLAFGLQTLKPPMRVAVEVFLSCVLASAAPPSLPH